MRIYHYTGKPYHSPLSYGTRYLIPLCLLGLFQLGKHQSQLMLWWVEYPLPWILLPIRTVTALVPFSVGEMVLILAVAGSILTLIQRIYQKHTFGRAILSIEDGYRLLSLGLWLWVLLCWLWNPLYYIPSFAQRGNLDVSPFPLSDLIVVTYYFSHNANQYADQVPRDEALQFAVPQKEYFQDAEGLYQELEQEYPFLSSTNVRVKPLLCSCLQSHFGFTGVYIPYTGEANINVHSPSVLHPVTIAHEMSHQRLIAPELEANFLGIAASLTAEQDYYRYSGYLFGLIQLSNALYPVAPEVWQELIALHFSDEMKVDWQTNYEYWQQFQSPVEELAKEVYDGFLKSNDQDLGIRSYGACVDLLVAYYREDAYALWHQTDPTHRPSLAEEINSDQSIQE